MLNTVNLYYFSPTGGTKKIADIFCKALGKTVEYFNLGKKTEAIAGTDGDITVVAAPVFGGRIPSVVTDRLEKLDGSGKKAVAIVAYGNRDFDDALLELKTKLEACKFCVIGAGAFVAQHSLVPEVGKGRPDSEDRKQICEFAKKVAKNTEHGVSGKWNVPGNIPYKPEMNMPVTPISVDSCSKCKKCADVCPTDAIRLENDRIETAVEKCILCMACAASCSEGARILPPPLKKQLEGMLESCKTVRGENQYFA